MKLLQRISTLAAVFAVTCAPTLAAGAHGHPTHTPPHPQLTPIVCNISGNASESLAYSQFVNNHGIHTPVLNFGITDDGTDYFGDLGAGGHIEGLDGTAFSSMIVTATGLIHPIHWDRSSIWPTLILRQRRLLLCRQPCRVRIAETSS